MNALTNAQFAEPEMDTPYALCGRPKRKSRNAKPLAGFSLLEVMMAMFIFFIVVFGVLGVVVQCLGSARALQQQQADCGMVASMTAMSNVLEENFDSGDFEGLVPGYHWTRDIVEVCSNGFFRVDIEVFKDNAKSKAPAERMSVLMYKPGGRKRRL